MDYTSKTCFEMASGLKVNFDKSGYSIGQSVQEGRQLQGVSAAVLRMAYFKFGTFA